MIQTRRKFIQTLSGAITIGAITPAVSKQQNPKKPAPHIASNQYPWYTFYDRQGKDWGKDLDASLSDFARSGIKGYEPLGDSPEQVRALAPLLKKYNLEMRSLYVGSILHKPEEASANIDRVLRIADAAKPIGTKIIVTNPDPIQWGGKDDKSDAQLEEQGRNLNTLGAALRKRGITLAYHNHDIEMRQAAREFHHMMQATDPAAVSLCLDVHWVYRGSGNSQVALFDIVKLYGKRIAAMHLRQSQGGVWSEVFGEGDIDYKRLAAELLRLNVHPHLVMEQCVEQQSPNTMDGVTAHQEDLKYATKVFAGF